MSLMAKLKKNSTIKTAEAIAESKYFKHREFVDTGIYAMNIMLSGRVHGGLESGFHVLGAPKAHFKCHHPDTEIFYYIKE